ncbi:MAG TPA: hypothetical protein VL418_05700 [Devosiaceae bacterium]|jgi:hypothetical protein|nr:hypothetical protein [Devosiaceae bacterium]
MDKIKSIAVPVTGRRGAPKPKRAGHPAEMPEHRVGGSVGPHRRVAGPVTPGQGPLYAIGQRLMLRGGGNHWARQQADCQVVALLPNEGGPFLYRVRSDAESHERVVDEADLSPID